MAMLNDSNYSNSSSSIHYSTRNSNESARRSNTQASAYAVDADTMALTGFHFSTTSGAGGVPSPPPSPDAAPLGRQQRPAAGPLKARSRSGDAAHHITEECERLFCETLRAVFLVERNSGLENSLVMDARNNSNNTTAGINHNATGGVQIPLPLLQSQMSGVNKKKTGGRSDTMIQYDMPTPSPSPDGRIYPTTGGMVREYVEAWDYAGGARFRGFVAEKEEERALFVFFDKEVIGKDLKPGLMALLELASSDCFKCTQLVVCVDREADEELVKETTRDLGWVGFELMMLDLWADEHGCLSDRWIFLGMDV